MYRLLKKIHIYVGLLNFSNLIVFGIAGLAATFQGGPNRAVIPEVKYEQFAPRPGSTDKEIAEQICERVRMPLAEPPPEWAIHRDADGNLPLDLWTVNGTRKILFVQSENRLRIEGSRNPLPLFVNDMHTVTYLKQADWRLRLWAWYNHFAIWSLLWMAFSGLYLWLATRPQYFLAQIVFASGAAVFALLYVLTR